MASRKKTLKYFQRGGQAPLLALIFEGEAGSERYGNVRRVGSSFPGRTFSQFSHSVVSDSLRPHGLQLARPPCPSPSPGACSNSCPFSRWCHPAISSSVVPFCSCLQSFPTSGSFPISQFIPRA